MVEVRWEMVRVPIGRAIWLLRVGMLRAVVLVAVEKRRRMTAGFRSGGRHIAG
tara:strand:- start:511 stop:669 length:159 start_codon:yes stop_codon:yes gene_type:complete